MPHPVAYFHLTFLMRRRQHVALLPTAAIWQPAEKMVHVRSAYSLRRVRAFVLSLAVPNFSCDITIVAETNSSSMPDWLSYLREISKVSVHLERYSWLLATGYCPINSFGSWIHIVRCSHYGKSSNIWDEWIDNTNLTIVQRGSWRRCIHIEQFLGIRSDSYLRIGYYFWEWTRFSECRETRTRSDSVTSYQIPRCVKVCLESRRQIESHTYSDDFEINLSRWITNLRWEKQLEW